MKYKAIGFDYGGVLAGRSAYGFALEVCELLDISFDTYKQFYVRYKQAVNRNHISWPKLYEKLTNEVGKRYKLPELLKLSDEYHVSMMTPDPKMMQLVDGLRSRGYKLGLLSNNTLENAKRFRAEGLDNHFDAFQVSTETGYVKPAAEAFEHFAHELGVPLNELVFVDDSPVSLSTADQLGYEPILFSGYEELVTRLKELGVL